MDIAAFFRELDLLFSRQEIQKVEPYLMAGLAQAEHEGDLAAVLSICNELGGFYRVQTRYAQGAAVFQKALNCISALGLEKTPSHATTLLNYATMLTAAGHTKPALEAFETAASIFRQAGGDPYALAALHNNISSLYYQLQEYDRAMEHADTALAGILQLPGSEDEQGVTHTKRAQILARQGRPDDALAALEAAKAAFAAAPEKNPGHYGAMLLTMGEVYGDLRRWEDSARYCEEALAHVSAASGRSRSYASVLRILSRAHRALGREDAAAACLREADAIDAQYKGGPL